MALISCSECQGKVSDKASACPHCGAPVEAVIQPDACACPACGHAVAAEVKGCPKCKAIFSDDGWQPERKSVQPSINTATDQKETKKSSLWKWILGVPVAGFVLVMIIGSCAGNTPDGKARANDRSAIEVCWEEQGRKSLDPATGRFTAAVCEKMERDFQQRWGFKP